MSLLAPPNDRTFSPRVVQVVALTGVACSSFTITVLSAALGFSILRFLADRR